mmetsp:Transcript_9657/g.28809  ORF Transcript_9657/g.28809 Transcript_9657/m.28809 type:complete len:105 (+) Transcript_9657:1223-1537(+)
MLCLYSSQFRSCKKRDNALLFHRATLCTAIVANSRAKNLQHTMRRTTKYKTRKSSLSVGGSSSNRDGYEFSIQWDVVLEDAPSNSYHVAFGSVAAAVVDTERAL